MFAYIEKEKEEIQQEIWDCELQLKIIKEERDAVAQERAYCESHLKDFKSGNFDTYYDICTGHTFIRHAPSVDFNWYEENNKHLREVKERHVQAKLKMERLKQTEADLKKVAKDLNPPCDID